MAGGLPFMSEGGVFARLEPEQKDRVLKMVGQKAKDKFSTYRHTLKEAFDFRSLDSQGRLAIYRARTIEDWNAKQEMFPDEYNKQIRDYYILERRVKGAQGTVAAAGRTGGENPTTYGPSFV